MAENAKTIRVVDDEPDTRTYLTTVLEDVLFDLPEKGKDHGLGRQWFCHGLGRRRS